MTHFNVGDRVEAVDEYGVWNRGQIVADVAGKFRINFDGYSSKWDIELEATDTNRVRKPTAAVELPKRRSTQLSNVSQVFNNNQNFQ